MARKPEIADFIEYKYRDGNTHRAVITKVNDNETVNIRAWFEENHSERKPIDNFMQGWYEFSNIPFSEGLKENQSYDFAYVHFESCCGVCGG